VKPYDADEVYRTLNTVAAFDWKKFFETRLQSKSADIPLGGVDGGGFKFVYTTEPNMFTDPWLLDGSVNAYGSLGIHVMADGTVDDSWPGSPAYVAGISNGMRLVAVNGRRFSSDEFTRALAASSEAGAKLDFIVENGSYFKLSTVNYKGGLRYPHLERKPGTVDVLKTIAAPRVR
jgi:predicted metalloprotease with PDZ domain